MKKSLLSGCLIIFIITGALASRPLKAYLTYATFNVPSKSTSYIETYITVIGNSVNFKSNQNNKFQGAVDISISFLQKGEIKNAKKYTLYSPEIKDTLSGNPNFIDQQRFTLENGDYNLEISIVDKNASLSNPFKNSTPVSINFINSKITISDIQLLESYTKSTNTDILTKSGYELVPYVSNYFPENIAKLKFYSEIYNTKKILGEGEKFLINYFLETFEKKEKLNEYSSFSKQISNDVNVLLTDLNIEKLPSGNYNLVIELRDKENKIIAEQRCFIQRQNKISGFSYDDLKAINIENEFVKKYKNVDTLKDYIRCLRPISGASEIQFAENQVNGKDLQLMQQYFYNFWKSRNQLEPEIAWLEYYKDVMKVNREFSSFGLKGYDTDRGRVYLQYGAPSFRNKVDYEPSSYPYEIWQYDIMFDKSQQLTSDYKKQSNRKFIFYNTDLSSNKYKLLHSDAKGETYNPRWEIELNKRNNSDSNLDNTTTPNQYGGNANDNFQNPR